MNEYSKMDLGELLEAFEENDISTFNKSQLKKVKSHYISVIDGSDSMLGIPLKEDEYDFFSKENYRAEERYEKIRIELESRACNYKNRKIRAHFMEKMPELFKN